MRRFMALIAASTAMLVAACSFAEPPTRISEGIPPGVHVNAAPLTLENVEEIALQYNPTLVQAGAQVRIAGGKAFQAGLLPNPEVGYVGDQIGIAGTAGELQGMFVQQEIVTGGKLRLSREKYLQETRQAEIQVFAQRCRVLYGIRVAYYEALIWQHRLKLRSEITKNAKETQTTLKELLNVGQANKADSLKSQIELRRSETDLQIAERRVQASFEKLAAMAGMSDLPSHELSGNVDFTRWDALNREATLNNILTCSPEIRFAQAEVSRDQIGLRREVREPVPNVTLRAETGYNFETDNSVAGLEVGLKVPVFDRNQGSVAQAQGELIRAQAEVQRIELTLRRRFAEVYSQYETSLIAAKTYREELLPQSEEVYKLYRKSFQEQRAAWPQVLDAQRDYYTLYEDYLNRLADARQSEAQLNFFLLEDGLTQPPVPTPGGHQDATPKPR